MEKTETRSMSVEEVKFHHLKFTLETNTKPINKVEKPAYALIHTGGRYILSTTDYAEFGRETFKDTVAGARFISKRHFALKYENGKLYIKDMGSKNGTYVNSEDIRGKGWVELKPGDSVEVASLFFKVVKLP